MAKAKQVRPIQREIATALGISPGRVSQLKKVGMPVGDIDQAHAWYANKLGGGSAAISDDLLSAAEKHLAAANSVPAHSLVPPDDEGAERGLWRSAQVERMAYAQIESAIAAARASREVCERPDSGQSDRNRHATNLAVLPGLIRTHGTALKNYQAAAKIWERHRQSVGLLVPFDAADAAVESRLGPLHSQLLNFPKLIAREANPQNPSVAESAITAGLRSIFAQISRAREPTPPPPES